MAILIFAFPVWVAVWYVPIDNRELAVYPKEVNEHQLKVVRDMFEDKDKFTMPNGNVHVDVLGYRFYLLPNLGQNDNLYAMQHYEAGANPAHLDIP